MDRAQASRGAALMGFRPKRTPFKLDFSGTEYEGLEVTVRPVSLSVTMDMVAACATLTPATMRQLAATFTYALESWNLEGDDGEPVAADADALLAQDGRFVNAVIAKWIEAMSASPP
jgi:hypothetical protein